MENYFVYILSNVQYSVLYIGVTNNLQRRIYEHKNKLIDGFTKKYNCTSLLYFEQTKDIKSAIYRERQLKNWKRSRKVDLIKQANPNLIDLYETICKY